MDLDLLVFNLILVVDFFLCGQSWVGFVFLGDFVEHMVDLTGNVAIIKRTTFEVLIYKFISIG